ncbi:MAG: sensor domain-containing diguanylate cyclase [Burkholderiaceae bacterium]|nr:sensor domain-containing diguanylate cyclase [Burkholderiaceae bacterium]
MQDSQLEAENLHLRRQLEALLREARANEEKMRRFDELEHRLIGARSVLELLRLLLSDYGQAFGIESVTLALVDADGETARILDSELRDGAVLNDLVLLPSAAPLEALYGTARKPWLGRFEAPSHARFFNAPPRPPRSVALLPLSRHGELIGSLHFGSCDAERYDPAAGTNLLERLASIVAVCLESVLNQERVKLAGLTDLLTGVHNRRYLEHRCGVEIAQARRYKHALACLFLDIDKFKQINDAHGHPAGDAVLRAVGHSIQSQLRAGDTIARYGGEEFVVLLPQTAAQHAREIAERIRASIAAMPCAADSGQPLEVTISIGLAMLGAVPAGQEPAVVAAELMAAADRALYRAKAGGRNRVVFEEA